MALVSGCGPGIGLWPWYRPLALVSAVGLNPITLYCLFQLSTSFIRHQLQIHLGQDVFAIFGDLWSPMMKRAGVLLVLWLIILWMYRRKVFLRL